MLGLTRYPSERPLDDDAPWLVFIHGLLGDGQDWAKVLPNFSRYSCATLDLPGHGASRSVGVESFDHLDHLLAQTLLAYNINRYILVGYSLGGRTAMYHAALGQSGGLCGLIIEGGNPGLDDPAERDARRAHDAQWAARFRQLPFDEALDAWYRQPVFADLDDEARGRMIEKRIRNNALTVADMLEATSLGRQPWLTARLNDAVEKRRLPFCYLCGERDLKFQRIALENHFPLRIVPAVGHNAHSGNPEGFAKSLLTFLKEC
ncbi:2-succinyl-6-hydroxy-2,4-cyclohexadiene-1-carboxylate synthase [Leminorella grimontii]|uniref:2-succinyl-6-hydroxy-2, 4-cyclohexadiene-1-carboxylate synthase n=1 Tax=Leminorella grimontii TaxID=82981 RepID=UPI00208C0C39|nr:2-succinyl-6-hydroxy-2,4-cyclohexadiene-1-carboxylate synthase [Leminorella grimontii]